VLVVAWLWLAWAITQQHRRLTSEHVEAPGT